MCSDLSPLVDVVGIGFGPSNLGLAIAIEEHNLTAGPQQAVTAKFFEKKDAFGWHSGMLLPGTTMQVSFLKDLATQRNARSEYTFLNYLTERGRLTHFINRQDFFPLRAEFHDYLCWAADRVRIPVEYSTDVTAVRWDGDHFEVVSDSGVVRARNLVLGGGLRAKLPAGVTAGPRVFHNHRMLHHFADLPSRSNGRYAVIGAGQSAAEVAAYLHDETDADVHAVFAKYGYTPADDSPYANRIFDPEAVDEYFAAGDGWRERLLQYHRSTNYSAVDPELIQDLYQREYTEHVNGHRRLFVHGATELVDIVEGADSVRIRVAHRLTGTETELDCDAVVFATGFEPTPLSDMLGDLAESCGEDRHGRPVLDRLYRVQTADDITGDIFVQGNSEHTHGLTSTLLSNVAVRSGEIVRALAENRSLVAASAVSNGFADIAGEPLSGRDGHR
ncbi:lysine N(6)-hydroxylase/L-ornithine N(5)-oxygenase family protein [Gordonia sp. OPL2]|uniref:lysine N(6)-hydroxylase/L-ornithine N(5)-oxygenase family protein n=1 Tax=Gordonia sp. OPL2 TaxID=2486274 RepID=UPI001655E68A|nr:SidA/IucD/PvdA family monooxygenase [Gordonia sp. OPL2]RPA19743.1 L-lysine 6-monooxygenase [Gordonia sp. OPL2]